MQAPEEVVKDLEQAELSLTALSVIGAFIRALETDYGYLFSPIDLSLAKHLYFTAIRADPQFIRHRLVDAFNLTPYGFQSWFFDKAVKPGYDVHMVGRKKLVSDTIEQAIEDGAKHIIVLGGGYDPQAFLAAQGHTKVKFYELDRGATRNIKISALQNLPDDFLITPPTVSKLNDNAVEFNGNFFCLECDFISDDLEKLLTTYGYNKDEKTLVIAEGLTMYLTLPQIQQVMASLRQLFSEDSQFLVSFIPFLAKTGSIHKAAINSSKEEYKASLKPEEIIGFAAEQGFQVTGKIFGEMIQIALGNHYAVECEKKNPKLGKENYYLLQTDPRQEGIKSIDEVPNLTLNIPGKEEVEEIAEDSVLDGAWSCSLQ